MEAFAKGTMSLYQNENIWNYLAVNSKKIIAFFANKAVKNNF